MASALYNSYKQNMLDHDLGIDLDDDALRAALVDITAGYTYVATHTFRTNLTNVTADGSTAGNFTAVSVTDGVFDAGDLTYPSVAGPNGVGAIVIYRNVGTAATDDLIAYIDGFTEVIANGGDITVTWDAGANRIFAL